MNVHVTGIRLESLAVRESTIVASVDLRLDSGLTIAGAGIFRAPNGRSRLRPPAPKDGRFGVRWQRGSRIGQAMEAAAFDAYEQMTGQPLEPANVDG